MPEWRHRICLTCWEDGHDLSLESVPFTVRNEGPGWCCFCRDWQNTQGAIYVRADGDKLGCADLHEETKP